MTQPNMHKYVRAQYNTSDSTPEPSPHLNNTSWLHNTALKYRFIQ